ncbi:HdeD family acid-resistance protein [Acetatifactor muris]|uniref:HdeD family acid-resistance protein n=1 Tax=Acetatifactor muris TaxID=879566 RepID=UPI0023F10434|nr:DUF308 domain-containing protein [Acetatifactor muris]
MEMKKYSGFVWMELAVGALLILLGIFTFLRPGSLLTGIVVIYGLIALITGVDDILTYIRLEKYTGFAPLVSLISGILSVMCGCMLLLYPNAGKWILSLLFPIWFIAHCISRLAHVYIIRMAGQKFFYYFALIINIVGLVLGILMFFNPMLTFMTMRFMGYVVAVYLILLGIDSIMAALDRKDFR